MPVVTALTERSATAWEAWDVIAGRAAGVEPAGGVAIREGDPAC